MRRRSLASLAICAGLALTSGWSSAEPAPPASTPPPAPHVAAFVTVTPDELRAWLPPPPAPDSLTADADRIAVLAAQAGRSAELERRAEEDAARGPVEWATWVLGPRSFDAERQPKAATLLRRLHDDLRAIVRTANATLPSRPRPPAVVPGVRPSLASERAGSPPPAYPSARAFALDVWSRTLAELYPTERERLRTAAADAAWLRVVGGAHYPTDLAGSERLAERVWARLAADPGFASALAEARAERAGLSARAPSVAAPALRYLPEPRPHDAWFPPPPQGAAATLELDTVRDAIGTRSEADLRWARAMDATDVREVARGLGLLPAGPIAPAVEALLAGVRSDVDLVLQRVRASHPRPRPAVVDPTLATAWPTPATPSYPSAKPLSFAVQLRVLATLRLTHDAARLDAWLAALAHSRTVAGVHYPSDSAAALAAAPRLAQLVVSSAAFAQERAALCRALECR
ncbi:MAG: hypothetical protein ACK52I_20625 [Pseudomonadota bacterium]